MVHWANADVLIDMLDRQRVFVCSQENERCVLRVHGWLDFLGREPQLQGIARDLVLQAHERCRELKEADHQLRQDLQGLWETYGSMLQEVVAGGLAAEEVDFLGTLDGFSERVRERPSEILPRWQIYDEDQTRTGALISTLSGWCKTAIGKLEHGRAPIPPGLLALDQGTVALASEVQHWKRRLRLLVENEAGVALWRLQLTARDSIPAPTKSEGGDMRIEVTLEMVRAHAIAEFASEVHSRGSTQKRLLERDQVTEVAEHIASDVALVTHALQLEIIKGRSRGSLVRRYAARCEAYEASELRELSASDRRRAERHLTRDFARYLFDQGLTPVMDPTIAGLRPDVVGEVGDTLFYVEAKQYSGSNPRSQIVSAYRQVWSTWGRLVNVAAVPEAFLLVFRLSGPRVELPRVLKFEGRRLWSTLVDISEVAGSREKENPIHLDESDLLPAGARTR